MSAKFACFVTGTDTEIGKTLVSSALLYALTQSGAQSVGMKPVAAGADLRDGVWHNDDVDRLAEASSLQLPQALTAPYILRAAAAPHIAAAQESVAIDIEHILGCYAHLHRLAEAIVVEGVGGFRVPLSACYDTADLAQRLDLPVILVVGLRLGCINHALLTVDEIAARGLVLAGWVANVLDIGMPYLEDNIEALATRIDAPLLGCLPRLALPTGAEAALHLDFSRLKDWPDREMFQ